MKVVLTNVKLNSTLNSLDSINGKVVRKDKFNVFNGI